MQTTVKLTPEQAKWVSIQMERFPNFSLAKIMTALAGKGIQYYMETHDFELLTDLAAMSPAGKSAFYCLKKEVKQSKCNAQCYSCSIGHGNKKS
jgi:hypothetical protein